MGQDKLLFNFDTLKLLSTFPFAPYFNNDPFISMFYKEIGSFRTPSGFQIMKLITFFYERFSRREGFALYFIQYLLIISLYVLRQMVFCRGTE